MSYLFKQIEDTYVVWLAPANRYMQLQEPAFRILEDWTRQLPERLIIRKCAHQCKLPLNEAHRFVSEVTDQLKSLVSQFTENQFVRESTTAIPLPHPASHTTKYYRINGMNFRFRYYDPSLEELFHPGFGYLEQASESKADHCFDLFYNDDQVLLHTGGHTTWQCPDSKTEYFVGLVYLQLLNVLHGRSDGQWMGAVHASAVSGDKGAVLFTAPSGSGKSTFAAMLMNQGYRVLSDDFSPISMDPAQVFPFPEGISVKNRSLKVLQPYFPSLAENGSMQAKDIREAFLPTSNGTLPAAERVKAIVFLQYNPAVELEFKKVSNLEAMDRFLQQLWLPPTTEVAERFMDWYFQVPCYTMNYSDTPKAIDRLSSLFK